MSQGAILSSSGGGGGSVTSVTGTANEITASPTTGAVILTTPYTFIAPGSIASTTTVTGGTGVIATTGNVTASAVASGLVLTPTVASGASSGTVVANGRVVSVTFTGIFVNDAIPVILTTSNTSITGSGTILLTSFRGATAGAALTMQTDVNSAGHAVFTFTNGAGNNPSMDDITITYMVLN